MSIIVKTVRLTPGLIPFSVIALTLSLFNFSPLNAQNTTVPRAGDSTGTKNESINDFIQNWTSPRAGESSEFFESFETLVQPLNVTIG
jgi:hypothetical protein